MCLYRTATGCFETDDGSTEGDGSSDYSHTDRRKYYFVNRTIKLWNQLPIEALATFPCKSHIFRMRFRKVIISEEKEGYLKGGDRNVQKCREMKNGD